MVMKLRWIAVILAAVLGAAAQASAADPLRELHRALFSCFLPLNEVQGKPDLVRVFAAARDEIWSAAGQAPSFRTMVGRFADPSGLGCGIAETASFDRLTPVKRRNVLFRLQTCSSNDGRRLAMALRNFYLRQTYGSLQEKLTGVRLNLHAPAAYAEQHRPKLAPQRLRYDAAKHEIFHADGEIDCIVAGSGPAGSVLGHELRRNGRRVLVIERGSFTVPGAMETRLIDELKENNGARTSEDGAIIIRNGNAVGGGSLVNVDLCFAPTLPSIRFKIEGWRREGRIGTADFTLPELERAYGWVKAAIGTRVLSQKEINANNRVLWDGAMRENLHPKLYDLNTYAPGQSPYPVTDKRASSDLLIGALQDERNPLSLLPDAEVRRVLFEDPQHRRHARGVEVRMRPAWVQSGVVADPNGLNLAPGTTLTIRARNVILAAGALGSPAILLRSEVPNDQIGRGAVLHCAMPLMGLFDRDIDALEGTQASVFVDDFLIPEGFALESMSAEPLYAAVMSPGPPKHSFEMLMAYRKLAGFGVMLVDTASPENRVRLDPDGEPVIEYTLSEADKRRFRHGVAVAARVMFRAGAKKVYLPTTEDILGAGAPGEIRPAVLTNIGQAAEIEKNLRFVPNRTMITSAHLQATNKMGSVVSRDFRVLGTEGLYVVDGSVFPTSVGANPMQSIYTFAKIFADRMGL